MNLNFHQAAFLWLWNKLNKLFKSVLESTFHTKGERMQSFVENHIFLGKPICYYFLSFLCNNLPFFLNLGDSLRFHTNHKVCEQG